MELLFPILLMVALGIAANLFGHDSRDGKPNWPTNRRTQPARRHANASNGTRSLMGRLVHPRGSRSHI